ncbi:MAG: LPS assembly protein LptD [Thermodesulfobacteriota bacterium]|nr:LPS assembly protein LptD [Thermodesulfobacteriota bacterium]
MIKRIYLLLCIAFSITLMSNITFAGKRFKDHKLKDNNAHWQITAKEMRYLQKEELYIAEGDVVITRNGQTLTAQKAVYNEKTGIVQVSGNVRLTSNGDCLSGEMGIFDLNNYYGQITNGRLFIKENHYYITGKSMIKTGPDTYIVKGCRVTTCDGDNPDWSITGSEVKVTIEGYGTVKNATFRIRNVPVFYVPYAIFPAKTKRQTGLLPPRLGYSNQNGIDVEIPFYWAISDQTDATFYERYMGKRGFMQGLEFRYTAENNSKGTFLFGILSDREEEKNLNDPEEVDLSPFPRTNKTRYWVRNMANQQFPLGIEARLDTDFVSDQDYLKEFRGGLFGFDARPNLVRDYKRPVEDLFSPTRRSALRLSRDGQEYSLQALTSYHQRPENPANDDTPQPLGTVNFTILPRPLPGYPLFLKFDMDYGYVWRDVGQKGHSVSFTPELSYPVWLGPYLEFEPSIRFTRDTQWLDDNQENIDRQSRDAYQLRARLSTILERTFDIEWKNAKKLKHKISPSLIYTFRSHRDEDRYRPWFEPIDVEGDINRISLSFNNLLDARHVNDKGDFSYSQWGTFNLSQGYNIDEARRNQEPWREKRPFEPLQGLLTLMLFQNLDFDAEAHYDHYDDDISFADISLELSIERSGGKKDSYAIDYQYTKGESENLNYQININLLYGFSTGTSLKRDLVAGHSLESSYWLDYQDQCWGVRLITGQLDGMDSLMVTFRLVGIESLKGR